ncbi:hypothetical protein HPB47_025971, partial [Ixodes persulcatus]
GKRPRDIEDYIRRLTSSCLLAEYMARLHLDTLHHLFVGATGKACQLCLAGKLIAATPGDEVAEDVRRDDKHRNNDSATVPNNLTVVIDGNDADVCLGGDVPCEYDAVNDLGAKKLKLRKPVLPVEGPKTTRRGRFGNTRPLPPRSRKLLLECDVQLLLTRGIGVARGVTELQGERTVVLVTYIKQEAQHLTKCAVVGHVDNVRNAAEIAAISNEPSPSHSCSTPPAQLGVNLKLSEMRGSQDGDARAGCGAEPGEGKKMAAEVNAANMKLGQKIAERSIVSNLPRIPANDYKIIIWPKNGLALAEVPTTRLSAAVRIQAEIPWVKGQEEDVLIVHDKKATLISSTPDMGTELKVIMINSIKIGDDDDEITVYLAPHEESGFTIEELTAAFGNPKNRTILGVRKLGNSSSAIVTFKHETVPRWMYCYGVPLKCVLPLWRVRTQIRPPPEDHVCEPKCKLFGKGNLTADQKCKEAFRTPYAIKKRQWKAKLRMEEAERKAKEAEVGDNCRWEKHQWRSKSQSRNRSVSRVRSDSFPRLPPRQEEEKQQKAGPGTAGTSGGAVLNNPAKPKSSSLKVDWTDKASQDKRDEEIFKIKEENRMLEEQLAAMSMQIAELQIAPAFRVIESVNSREDMRTCQEITLHYRLNRHIFPGADRTLSKKKEV